MVRGCMVRGCMAILCADRHSIFTAELEGKDCLVDKDADGTIIRQPSLKLRCLRARRAEIIQQLRNFMTSSSNT